MRVLVISAHPDDELWGMGGTVARNVEQEDTLRPAVMCEGIRMRYHSERHAEVVAQSRKAAGTRGVSDLVHRDLPDQKPDTLPLSDVIGGFEELVQEMPPEVAYTHFRRAVRARVPKVEAFLSYTAEVRDGPHPRSARALR